MAVPAKETKASLEAASPYAVNKTLFEASTKVKNQLELVQKRLDKMEEHRDQVSDAVYLKVKADYETQLDEIRGQFEEKCEEIKGELQQLYQARSEQEADLAKHQEVLEEAKFRHTLGEYTDKKFKDVESKQNKEIKKFNELLETIKGSIEQYENVIGEPYTPTEPAPAPVAEVEPEAVQESENPDPLSEISSTDFQIDSAEPEHTPPTGTFSPATPATETSAPNSAEAAIDDDLDSFLQTEGDYFGGGAEEAEAKPEAKPESAQKPNNTVSTTQPDDDSISSILQDIPIEEPDTGNAETQTNDEPTGNKIVAAQEFPEASLLLLEGDLEEPEYILGENTSIGRSPSNDLVLKESKVSRQHAAINYRDGQFLIVDLKSSNGILINDEKVEEGTLKDGDELRVGSFKFQFNIL